MILADLKDFVKSRRQVSLREAALHFDTDPDAVKGMLEFWVSKGKISKNSQETACGGGCGCGLGGQDEIYIWNPQLGEISIETR